MTRETPDAGRSVDRFADWDASYVLGALSPTERREFERHLASCESCSAAVAELAGMPGILAKVSADGVDALSSAPIELPVPSTLLPRLVRSVARRRRRLRGFIAGGVVAAAAAAAAAVLVFPLVFSPAAAHPTTSLSLSQVVPSPLSADLRLVSEGWGTRIEMDCSYGDEHGSSAYPSPDDDEGDTRYAMFVTDADGNATEVATWTAKPGSTVEPSGTTSLAVAEIRSVDIRSVSDGTVLLQGSL